jgi:putative Mg2+ transporter-C (MgtC) family protein
MTGSSVLATGVGTGQGWTQVGELLLAFLLASLVGLEREIRQKNAGLRTHTLVGVGAALFMLTSKFGFMDVLEAGRVVVDPSRVAAQIVTGIGFLGAGIIFVRRDSVRGLTTAASIWVTAAIGAAAGAGLVVLACLTTAIYFVIAVAFTLLSARIPRSSTAMSVVRVRYPVRRGILSHLLDVATSKGFTIDDFSTEAVHHGSHTVAGQALAEVTLHVHGKSPVQELASALSEEEGVEAVLVRDLETAGD